jgi:hypothetical protein
MSVMALTARLLKRHGAIASNVATRVYPVSAPQQARLPYLLIDLVTEAGVYTLSGAARWYEARVSVAVIAEKAIDADALGELVRNALEDQCGEIFDVGSPPKRLGEAEFMYVGSVFDESEDRSTHRRLLDFETKWRQ